MKNTLKFGLTAFAFVALVATNAEAAISVNSVSAVGVNASSGTTVTASSGSKVNASGSMASSAKATSSSSSTNDSSVFVNISVGGDDSRSNENLDMSIWSSTQVQSDGELKMYAETLAHNDTSVGNISSTDNSVEVSFKRPARLFGLIPVKVSEKAVVKVNSEGKSEVSVKKSWWAFLAADDLKSSDLSVRITAKLAVEDALASNGNLSASAKAKILSDIQVASNNVYSESAE